MFEQWPSWIARNRVVRRTAVKAWWVYLRARRACLANVVLVVRSCDGRVLLMPSPLGGFSVAATGLIQSDFRTAAMRAFRNPRPRSHG
jgi:hypothetical protein